MLHLNFVRDKEKENDVQERVESAYSIMLSAHVSDREKEASKRLPDLITGGRRPISTSRVPDKHGGARSPLVIKNSPRDQSFCFAANVVKCCRLGVCLKSLEMWGTCGSVALRFC